MNKFYKLFFVLCGFSIFFACRPASHEEYSVSIDPNLKNGKIEVKKNHFEGNELVEFCITPDMFYRLKEGSLFYRLGGKTENHQISESKIFMPTENIFVSCEFEIMFEVTVATSSDDGKISGVTSEMQYCVDDSDAWVPCDESGKIDGLGQCKVKICYKDDDTKNVVIDMKTGKIEIHT